MDEIKLRNIKLLNLIEKGHSSRTLLRILSVIEDKIIEKDDIYNVLGKTPTAENIINDLYLMQSNYYSIYCLLFFDINIFIIEKIKENYDTCDLLSSKFEEFSEKIKLQKGSYDKILFAINELSSVIKISPKTEILNQIKQNEPILNNVLKEKILNKYPLVSVYEFDSIIDELIAENKISNTFDGYKIRKEQIGDYLLKSSNPRDELVLKKCRGATLESIAQEMSITRERVRQIIKKRISSYPIFYNEIKYYKFLSIYDFEKEEFALVGLTDYVLIEYIFLKYEIKPLKNSIDYINDLNLFDSDLGKKVLRKHKLIIIGNELVNFDFITLFKKYVISNSLHSFCVDDIADDYNKFLSKLNIYSEELCIGKNIDDIKIKTRKIEHQRLFISVTGRKFLIYKEDSLSFDFIEAMDKYLDDFYGYGSVSFFYDNNKELCNKNFINDEFELFALMKRLFVPKYGSKIEFVRNPVIVSLGVDKEAFIENMILDMELPCTVEDYLSHIRDVTGLKEASVLANFYDVINRYKNSTGLISLDDEIPKEDYERLCQDLNEHKCIGYNYLRDKLEIRYGSDTKKVELLLNSNNLKKIGYIKTNTAIYSNLFNNRLEAVQNELLDLDYILSENELSKISNKEYFYYKMFDLVDECLVVKISDNNYLNVVKREQTCVVKNLKKDIEDNLDNNGIYTIDDYLDSYEFKKVLDTNSEYKDLLYSFDTKAIVSYLVMTIRSVNYLNSWGTIIFSKSELSMKILLDDILNEYGSLTLIDLKEKMMDEYKIKKEFSNSELSEMGYYCPKSSEKIYLTKEYYEKEMEEILNGDS